MFRTILVTLLSLHVCFTAAFTSPLGVRQRFGTSVFASLQAEAVLTEHAVVLRKPMGITLAADESNPHAGVIVKKMDPTGLTAAACRSDPIGVDICVRDKVIKINGKDVSSGSYEDIMRMLIDGPKDVNLVLGRPSDAVVVRWANGISVAAMPGDSFKSIAKHESFIKIPYLCTSGGCRTCEQSLLTGDGEVRCIIPRVIPLLMRSLSWLTHHCIFSQLQRFRPCCARVPKSSSTIIVNPADR